MWVFLNLLQHEEAGVDPAVLERGGGGLLGFGEGVEGAEASLDWTRSWLR